MIQFLKERPRNKPRSFPKKYLRLLRFVLTGALVEDLHHGGDTDDDVDNPFNHRPCSQEQIYNVEIHAEESAETDETPVESTDKHECPRKFTDGTHVAHKEEKGGK